MLITEQLEKKHMTKYKLSKASGVPQTTINDICSGRTDLEKCSAGTLYRIAKVLGITVEQILESGNGPHRKSFDVFKSTICHHVKDMGDLEFIADILQKDQIRVLYERKWYPESLYLLAMVDYLSRVNGLPLCTRYNDIRAVKLEKPIFPSDLMISSEVLGSDRLLLEAERNAIPEFRRFNIIENEVRNVV